MPADRAELEAMSIDAIIHSLIAHSPNLGQVVDAVRELQRRIGAARTPVVPEDVREAAESVLAAHEFHEPKDCNFLRIARFILTPGGPTP